ncbi:MAG: hypothetical protein BMS9Abin08_1141 [Gammaproteobacteria bacterium]|nr:MAG: hypothetical protein BMS9Abin08_1141 [Gammaproteobacteria bacterium]
MRLVLLGAPGCGKGTQGQRLAERYKIPEISTGDLLRQAVAAGTALGKAAKVVMDAGKLVSDDIVLGVIGERMKLPDARKGFILVGFPRNLAQAEQLDELFEELGQPIDLALLIEVEVDSILQRLLGRRTCMSCGASYNIFYAPPRMDDGCDACGGHLKRRSDDNEETIGNRLRIYESQTLPVVERYREQGRLRVIQGIGDIDDVFKAVSKAIEEVKSTFGSRDRSAAIRRAVARKQKAVSATSTKRAVARAIDKADKKVKSGSAKKSTAKAASAAGKKKTVARKKVVKKKVTGKKVTKKKTVAKKKTVSRKAPAKKKAAVRKKVLKKAVLKKKAPAKKTAKKKAGRKR